MAFDRLIDKIVEMQNPTVAGLDPKLDYVPQYIKDECFAKCSKTLEVRLPLCLSLTRRLLTPFMR